MSLLQSVMVMIALAVLAYTGLIVIGLKRRGVGVWWRDYLRHLRERRRIGSPAGPTDIMFCFVDHFEPRWEKADYATELKRVARWASDYPKICAGHQDADGRPPQHTFFYPSEEYRPEHLDRLVDLCRKGFGEIEVHLHHDDDTEAGLRTNLGTFLEQLVGRHDALPVHPDTGRPMWAFVHGNWALDNSRQDGRWCGVNNELLVLKDLGCYADFTLPSAPSDTQTSTVNSIYYATDDPARPKSHDTGEPVRVGGKPVGDMMIIQGPLCLRWKMRGILPVLGIENGDVRLNNLPTPARVDAWIRTGVHVKERPEWVFVKVHTHGAQDRDMDVLLGAPMTRMFDHLERTYNDGKKYRLHYVSAREMHNIARAAEAGCTGSPGSYRDFAVPRPRYHAHQPAMQASAL
jgi:hypothetical protein